MDIILTQHARARMADPHRGVVTEEDVRSVLASPTVSYVGIDGKHIRVCFVEEEDRLADHHRHQPRNTSMKLEYDAEADAAYILLSETSRSRTEEESDACIVDFDPTGNVVGIVVRKGLLSQQDAERLLRELRHELVAA